MESRPDLIPPCCAACAKAGIASVDWYAPDERTEDGWRVRHGTSLRPAEHGAEAMAMLQELHYASAAGEATPAVSAEVEIHG